MLIIAGGSRENARNCFSRRVLTQQRARGKIFPFEQLAVVSAVRLIWRRVCVIVAAESRQNGARDAERLQCHVHRTDRK
jgi:hypothetical protein